MKKIKIPKSSPIVKPTKFQFVIRLEYQGEEYTTEATKAIELQTAFKVLGIEVYQEELYTKFIEVKDEKD